MLVRTLSTWIVLLLAAGAALAEEARLLRFADIHEDRIAFVYAGDIWLVPSSGGVAQRLTSDVGMELFPKFSPDGRWIAFSGEYGGNRQVWVVSVDGGAPRQLTFHNDVGAMPPRGGFDYRVLDWTPDGREILFRANRLPWGVRMGRPYLVPFEGGMEHPLAVPEAGGGMLSPDGKRFVYTPIDREFRTWKRYHGGRAQDVWIYDLENDTSEAITEYDGTDNQPVWVGSKIYFTSDRENGRLNLWSWDPQTRAVTRVTKHRDFDVLWPSAGPRQIVYEAGGYLYRWEPAKGGDPVRVPVEIRGDFRQTVPRIENVRSNINASDVSPSGKRAVFAARGDLFTVPAENGEIRNLTRTPGIREDFPAWSPDGRRVAYLSDRTGEYELYVRDQDGSGEERRITTDGDTWRFTPVWSPDSRKLAFGDTKRRLRWVDVESGKITDVDKGDQGYIFGYAWSPDSRWLAYNKVGDSQFSSIWVYSLDDHKPLQLTDDFTNDFGATFDPDGRYLYFFSDRDYNLTFSGYEFNYFYTNPTRLYAATLQADGPALLLPKSDEEEPKKSDEDADKDAEGDADKKNKKDKKDKQAEDADEKEEDEPLRIDVDGFAERVVALPGSSGNYGNLSATADAVFYTYNDGNGPTRLESFQLKDEETKTVLDRVSGYTLSGDGKKILYRSGRDYGIVDAKPEQKSSDGRLSFDGMTVKIDPRVEWEQIFVDAWRITRDWFYDPGMHGVDWKAVRRLYEPLVAHVSHRGDLDYILGEMGGELSAGHYYVNWGDMPRPDRVDGGLLGAEIEAHDSGYFTIAKIFPGENWHAQFRSPLTVAGVDVDEGDFILAVDGLSTRDVDNFYSLLEGKSGRTVTLRVNAKPDEDGAHDEKVVPISQEQNLRYLDWVQSRREMVDRLSGGRIGYIHLPNTGGPGNRELRKAFYPQAHKDALILDVRYNGGGFIPDRMIELLTRERLSYWARRGVQPSSTPGYVHEGPKACLINGYSSSGGDAFPYYFRKMGLGPLIGTRTWGGLIGLSGNPGLIDGGSVSVPTFRFLDTEGNWAVENVGVAPDIEVVDRPEFVAKGQDPTLERAVEYLLEELRRNPPKKITVPAPPRIPR